MDGVDKISSRISASREEDWKEQFVGLENSGIGIRIFHLAIIYPILFAQVIDYSYYLFEFVCLFVDLTIYGTRYNTTTTTTAIQLTLNEIYLYLSLVNQSICLSMYLS